MDYEFLFWGLQRKKLQAPTPTHSTKNFVDQVCQSFHWPPRTLPIPASMNLNLLTLHCVKRLHLLHSCKYAKTIVEASTTAMQPNSWWFTSVTVNNMWCVLHRNGTLAIDGCCCERWAWHHIIYTNLVLGTWESFSAWTHRCRPGWQPGQLSGMQVLKTELPRHMA